MRKLCWTLMLVICSLLGHHCKAYSQNIPPLIGDQIGKPKITIPNPLGQQAHQRDASSQSYSTSPQDAEIHDFLNGFVKSVADRNLEKLGACYSQQPTPVVYWDALELRGWEAIQTEWEKLLGQTGGVKLTLKDLDIHAFGRFAWVTATYLRERIDAGSPHELDGHVTFVLEKKRAQWWILHEHVSQVSGSAPGV
jgi:ketosteroid isomerase-like protein